MDLTFEQSIKVAINSLTEGIIDKGTAMAVIEDAAHNCCIDCMEAALQVSMKRDYPLDSVTCEEVTKLYQEKNMILQCEDGHVMGMYRENFCNT